MAAFKARSSKSTLSCFQAWQFEEYMDFGFNLNRTANTSAWRFLPNRWDFVAFPLIICLIAMAAIGFHETMAPIGALQTQAISLDPSDLPEYALRTTLRMVAAMVASLIFTLAYGTLAAKSRRAGLVLVPILDILQSVPVLGYISFTVTFFLALFPGRVIGAECAAIFAIFTSQAWNMTFSFYQSLRTVPRDLDEVSRGFHLTNWQRFWKLEVPFSMPGLIWNMMMSMSGGWFFVVASEAITVGNNTITLPGIGAYLAQAITEKNMGAVGWVILTMTVVILGYDQLLFRPLVAWADKFRMETTSSGVAPESWVPGLVRRTRLIHQLLVPAGWLLAQLARIPLRLHSFDRANLRATKRRAPSRFGDIVWSVVVIAVTLYVVWRAVSYVRTGVDLHEVGHVLVLGLITLLRVAVLIAISSMIWVPLGMMIGLRPALAEKVQPLAPADGFRRFGGFGVSSLSQCRVAAFGVCGLLELANFFITVSHCAWRHVISLSKATKKRSKENAFNHATLSVHSVQFPFIGAPKARCSPEPRMCEPLLLANPDTNTLRPVRSRASTICPATRPAPRAFEASFLGRLIEW